MFETPLSHTHIGGGIMEIPYSFDANSTVQDYCWDLRWLGYLCGHCLCMSSIFTMLNIMLHYSLPEPSVNDRENIINGLQGQNEKTFNIKI